MIQRQNNSGTEPGRIVIVGAGVAGTAAAVLLGRKGLSVALVDPHLNFPPVFKAEKIESDQADLLRKCGLFEPFLARAARIREIHRYFNGRMFECTPAEQYGLYYSDMVHALRVQLPETVEIKRHRVARIKNSTHNQRILLDNGEEFSARLVVLASGLNSALPASLGFKRITVRSSHSVAVAFTLAPANGRPFPFDAVTYYPAGRASAIDYLSIFRFRGAMRANLFAFPGLGDRWTARFLQQPKKELDCCFPKLRRAIGDYRVQPKIESSLIHLYRTEGVVPGVVMIGDAAQNVCPSTGMGLTKVFTDVYLLCSKYVPMWLETPKMDCDKMATFWGDPEKRAVDAEALRTALYRRRACTERSLRWKIHRARLHFTMRFGARIQIENDETQSQTEPVVASENLP